VKPQDVQLAMERGEVDGLCTTTQSFRNFRPDWVRSGQVRVLFTLEKDPVPWLDAPTVYKFVKTTEQRQTLDFFSSSIEMGRPLLLPPDVPPERVGALRRAFEATVNDPLFRDEAKRMGFEIALRTGEELQTLVQAAKETPPEIVERVSKIVQAAPN
jgi:tripartite-type tricarboxylate transporter receptor subunit TctC